MLSGRLSLEEFLIEERKKHAQASGDLNGLIIAAARACKVISHQVAAGQLVTPYASEVLEDPGDLETLAEGIFRRLVQTSGRLAGILSPREAHIPAPSADSPPGKYLFLFNPLEGVANLPFNVPAGSIFSILRTTSERHPAGEDAFLAPGSGQVCAGYAIYGPSTMLVLSVGTGTHGFTLDPILGEFVLTHPGLKIPARTDEFAVNAVNHRIWEPAVKRYVDECVAGSAGTRGRDFSMRWVASLVAETHNILLRGGVFLNPRNPGLDECGRHDQARLLYAANPVAFLVEQAGGSASTGRRRILDIEPRAPHQEIGLIFGSSEEVERLQGYHTETTEDYNAPLFGVRGLFRD